MWYVVSISEHMTPLDLCLDFLSPGRRAAVSSCTFTKDGRKMIAGAMTDGSIQLWKNTGNFVRNKKRRLLLFLLFLYGIQF